MKLRIFFRSCALLLFAELVLNQFTASAQTRQIRLRNEIISTTPAARLAPAAQFQAQRISSQAPAFGLFLIQFETVPTPTQRAELRASGVQLLKYVPDNAFVARFINAAPEQIAGLSNVRWVGPYLPEYKIHSRLGSLARSSMATRSNVVVNILISPEASTAEISRVRGLLVSVQHESRLRQGVVMRGVLNPARLEALSRLDPVLWIEPAPKRKLVDESAAKLVGGDDGDFGTPTLTQQLGFDGSGVTVCVADTGLDTGDTNTMHPDLFGRVVGFKNYGALADGSDGYGHGTHVAGIVAGNAATGEVDPDSGALYGLGVASGANLFIERIFDDNASEVDPLPSDSDLARDAVRAGAQIGANSWGNDVQGEYDIDAAEFDELVRDADDSTAGDQQYVLEFSAGNAGPYSESLDSPASGKNVIATGASENIPGTLAATYGLYADGPDTLADFSSRGPCQDGRIKPDLVAPGTWIASAASSMAFNLAATSWSPIDDYYVFMGGTSMAGPHAAGAAAVFVQYYKSLHTNAVPSPALVKAALINSADELDQANGGPGSIPNSDEGWGRINLANIVVTNLNTAPRYYQYSDQSVLLTSGQVHVQHVLVRSAVEPLKITLTYTDVPGFPGAIPALVNDLDLEVIAPDGTVYRGNQFTAGESVPNAPSADNLNNVEGVHLAQPIPGDYVVRIVARNVVQDSRLDTAAIDQDFALVASGDLARPNGGFLLLDRSSYTAPSVVRMTIIDPLRANNGSVNVRLKSTTEPAGETYVLQSAGNYGVFTGAVQTIAATAAVDGKLEIHNGDAIEADYTDGAGNPRVAMAVADLVLPLLSNVAVTKVVGVMTITWQSSELANSVVRYGTNLSFGLGVTNSELTTSHSIKLGKLIPGATYYFYVTSADPAGNTVTNNNAGAYYTFVGAAVPTVLLVDDYDSVGEDDAGSTVIPDSAYTNALSAAGFTYGFWKVNERGYPQLADLQPFQIVIWRTTDDIVNYEGTNNTINAQEQFIIQNYLSSGGSFFMSSMGILSQLGNVSFRRNVLQVARFKQNPDPPAPCENCDEFSGVPAFTGAAGDLITDGMQVSLDYGNYPFFDLDETTRFGPDFSCTFTPATNATAICFESSSGKPCGISYPRTGFDSPGRVVFLSFPIDCVPFGGTAPNNEVTFLRKILNFLGPGANGAGTLFLNNTVYTMPDQVVVEVGDSDLAGTGSTQVIFSASSGTNQVQVTLNETTHAGLFRGFLTLVATNASGDQLAVHGGDTITAKYFDASNGSNVVTTASIDNVPPVITQVSANTGTGDAIVSWQTSKPADSLVQYGESVILNRTAYNGFFVTNHAVNLTGLLANRDYHFQVVSRDPAGNTTIDDNNGALYSFTTKAAPKPPWSDNLESGAPGWTVIPDPENGSDVNWTLGVPSNGIETSAHSGTNAWGSNLNGQPFDFLASSFLYSPMIDLSGFSQATLTFWHSFDFSSGLEDGQVGVSTNTSTPPGSIPTLADYTGQTSDGWGLETINLTPYAGKTIQVVWYYQGVYIGSPLSGWLVDDVSITGVASDGAGGTIVISKNLGQGSFTLSGLINQTGKATETTITNAPAGSYNVQFSDVPFYQTPFSQSDTLTNGGTVNFAGNYTFIDANHNGISDSWEKFYFGSADTNRTQFTDTIGSGMSDYGKFIAGLNPTNPASRFVILSVTLQTNRAAQLQWAAIPGRLYRAESSSNLVNWTPLSDWLQAIGSPMNYLGTNLDSGLHFFRVQVRP